MKTGSLIMLSPNKLKKASKEREKRKSQGENNHNSNNNDKTSPIKENAVREYAGISPDIINAYAEQIGEEDLSEEIGNLLCEDINYKLRYIIHDALLKARLQGRNHISSKDIEETFDALNIEKVYGASSFPSWSPSGVQNYLCLDDTTVNLIEVAEEELFLAQPGEVVITKQWYPNTPEIGEALKTYFTTMCEAIVDNDQEVRQYALQDISENPQIGPIIDWFYNFGYLLLSKDKTYDCFTLYALELISVLESCPLGSENVSEDTLKLLIRLILQRLLLSVTTEEILRPMCAVLAELCLRPPLKHFVIVKLEHKLATVDHKNMLPFFMLIQFLGVEAVSVIFLPNLNYFLTRYMQNKTPAMTIAVLGIYAIIQRAELGSLVIDNSFKEVMDNDLIFLKKPVCCKSGIKQEKANQVSMKVQLVLTRRKIDFPVRKTNKCSVENAFEKVPCSEELKRKLWANTNKSFQKGQGLVTIGRMSLLSSVFKHNKSVKNCFCGHMLHYTL